MFDFLSIQAVLIQSLRGHYYSDLFQKVSFMKPSGRSIRGGSKAVGYFQTHGLGASLP